MRPLQTAPAAPEEPETPETTTGALWDLLGLSGAAWGAFWEVENLIAHSCRRLFGFGPAWAGALLGSPGPTRIHGNSAGPEKCPI